MGDKAQAFGGHAWNEVVLDGYRVPVDATWHETVIDAAHIRYPTISSQNLAAMASFAGATLKVIEVDQAK